MAVRQEVDGRVEHRVHLLLGFADRQAAERVAVKAYLNQLFRRLPPQLRIHAALHDAEEELAGGRLRGAAAFRPARGEGGGLGRFIKSRRIGNAGVQDHHDVRAKCLLHFHHLFRAEEEFTAVNMRTKLRALFGDFGQLFQAEYLEAAGIGEDWLVPVHEFMQSAENAADQLMAGPDEEVVGVAKNDLRSQLQQVFRGDGFDRSLRAHRHKNRGLNAAMQGGNPAATGRALGRLVQQSEGGGWRHSGKRRKKYLSRAGKKQQGPRCRRPSFVRVIPENRKRNNAKAQFGSLSGLLLFAGVGDVAAAAFIAITELVFALLHIRRAALIVLHAVVAVGCP